MHVFCVLQYSTGVNRPRSASAAAVLPASQSFPGNYSSSPRRMWSMIRETIWPSPPQNTQPTTHQTPPSPIVRASLLRRPQSFAGVMNLGPALVEEPMEQGDDDAFAMEGVDEVDS